VCSQTGSVGRQGDVMMNRQFVCMSGIRNLVPGLGGEACFSGLFRSGQTVCLNGLAQGQMVGRSGRQVSNQDLRCATLSVSMLQSAQAWQRNHRGVVARLLLDRAPSRRILAQRIVNPVLMIVPDVILKQAEQVTFVQSNDMVQHLAATASHPALRRSILPGRLHACPFDR
jgi:hypothetical protein